jgi:aryl-alcohol dehydrogenase-like predicted oxidoreductase
MSLPPLDDAEGVATLHAALEAGINFLDTADFYGMGHNESLIGRALKGRREQAFLSVKCGMMRSPTGAFLGLEGRPASIKNFATYSLQRLGVEVIDLYQAGRADPQVPYEETVGAIADLIAEGKVRYLGVSEVGADLLRRAHAVHPVTAIEIEYSLACRFIEADILPTARDLGVGVVPYRVLADGLLSGAVSAGHVGGNRHFLSPRLEGADLAHNLDAMAPLHTMAMVKGVAPARLAIEWLLSRGEDVVPIVGIRSRARLAEALTALDPLLDAADLSLLDHAFAPGAIHGDRYPAFVQKYAAA